MRNGLSQPERVRAKTAGLQAAADIIRASRFFDGMNIQALSTEARERDKRQQQRCAAVVAAAHAQSKAELPDL